MTPTSKKVLFVVTTVAVISIGIVLYLKKKKADNIGSGESLAAIPANGAAPGSWKRGDPTSSTDVGDQANPYHLWGYARRNATKGADPVPYPQVKVFTPDGKQYGDVYTGDAGGVYNLWIPADSYIVEITAPDYLNYRNAAHVVSNGYKLFMRKVGE